MLWKLTKLAKSKVDLKVENPLGKVPKMVSKETKVASSGHGLLLERVKVMARVKRASRVKAMTAIRSERMAKARALQSKGQGAPDHNQCRLCGQTGHWQRDCWMNKRVQQIAQNASQLGANAGAPALPQSQVANPTAASSRQLPSNAQQDRVKRVICLLDPPSGSSQSPTHSSSTVNCRVVSIFPMDDSMNEWLPESQPEYEVFDLN